MNFSKRQYIVGANKIMNKKIVLSFPGSRGSEIPLLYFAAKHYEDLGYEKVFVNNPIIQDTSYEVLLNTLIENAKTIIESLNLSEYDNVVFIAKSIGTVVACKIKEIYNLNAQLILFTPIEDTLKYIKSDNNILLVSLGTKDRIIEWNIVKSLCETENINCYIEENVGHRMEVMNDLQRNLEIIYNIISKIKC